ncbi:di-heme oxidoredictase family protein [Chryseobacterium carnipullorum]|nr:di-heme oxidoredictase family protein [Chryseobacterium carnipullorum]
MHDGRAKSIEEAIQLHGGEAATSRNQLHSITSPRKRSYY